MQLRQRAKKGEVHEYMCEEWVLKTLAAHVCMSVQEDELIQNSWVLQHAYQTYTPVSHEI